MTMGWIAVGTAVLGAGASIYSSNKASSAAEQAARTSADYQMESLDYLKEREKIPRQFSEQGLKQLGGLYGMEGGTGSQQELIDQAIQSPLYQSIMGGKKAGEESILRNASMTGGMRSGNVQSSLYDYNTQLSNQALLESYNQQLQGLTGLAGLPSNANAIAQAQSGIGQTLAQGQVAAGQAQQAGIQGVGNSALAGASMYAKYQGTPNYQNPANYYSDRRLKNNLEKIGEFNGHNWYKWNWNIVAQKMGMKGQSEGVLADEIIETNPECISFRGPFLTVNYNKLGIFKEVA